MEPANAKSSPPIPANPAPAVPRIDAARLFAGNQEIVLVHAGTEYRLRITAAGKLLLTK